MNYWIAPSNIKNEITVSAIVDIFEHETEYTFKDLTGKSRKGDLPIIRHLFVYVIKKHLNYSLVKIGELLGNRDHTTAIHSIRASLDLYDTSDDFRNVSDKIQRRIMSEYAPAVRFMSKRIDNRKVRRLKAEKAAI